MKKFLLLVLFLALATVSQAATFLGLQGRMKFSPLLNTEVFVTDADGEPCIVTFDVPKTDGSETFIMIAIKVSTVGGVRVLKTASYSLNQYVYLNYNLYANRYAVVPIKGLPIKLF